MPTYPLNYSLLVTKVGRCLNGCSQHGACSEDGVCACSEGWAGGDCSVAAPSRPVAPGMSGLRVFWIMVLSAVLGCCGTFVYIHLRGVPGWLPIKFQYLENLGLYQELSGGREGI